MDNRFFAKPIIKKSQTSIEDNIFDVHTIGTGEPLFNKNQTGPAIAALLASKLDPIDYENDIVQILQSLGVSQGSNLSPQESQGVINELTMKLTSKYGGIINKINPNLLK